MPSPLSLIARIAESSFLDRSTVTVPPRGVNFTEFARYLSTAFEALPLPLSFELQDALPLSIPFLLEEPRGARQGAFRPDINIVKLNSVPRKTEFPDLIGMSHPSALQDVYPPVALPVDSEDAQEEPRIHQRRDSDVGRLQIAGIN